MLRTLDPWVTFRGRNLLSVVPWHIPMSHAIGEGLNCHHCQQPVVLWLSCPMTRPSLSEGNLQAITLHNGFYYHMFAHSHATVFSNKCSRGRMTPIISVYLKQFPFAVSWTTHCGLQACFVWFVMKILDHFIYIASLICFFFFFFLEMKCILISHSWCIGFQFLSCQQYSTVLAAPLLTYGWVAFLFV